MDIRKLILNSAPPFEWNNDETHPIHSLGYYVFGIYDATEKDKLFTRNELADMFPDLLGHIREE